MRNDKIRRFKPRMNKFRSRRPSNGMKNNGIIHQNNIHRNGLSRNHVNKNPHNLERIIEKYKNLAKEALKVVEIKFYTKIIYSILIIFKNSIRIRYK